MQMIVTPDYYSNMPMTARCPQIHQFTRNEHRAHQQFNIQVPSIPSNNLPRSVGNFLLGKVIGEGTFGKVVLARHTKTSEKVAIKILEKDRLKNKSDVNRVSREISVLKRIRHPHVVQLFEVIETRNRLYIVMEYAPNGELFDYIVHRRCLSENEARTFFKQIISGLNAIHENNVAHRDLKPENLLLDENMNIKIADFGLANIFENSDSKLKTACGSQCYASPEMICEGPYYPAPSDIWSCGVILYAMLCGYLPFEDENTHQLYSKIINGEYRIPSHISPGARSMIKGILQTNFKKRLDVTQIKSHLWFRSTSSARGKNAFNYSLDDLRNCGVDNCASCLEYQDLYVKSLVKEDEDSMLIKDNTSSTGLSYDENKTFAPIELRINTRSSRRGSFEQQIDNDLVDCLVQMGIDRNTIEQSAPNKRHNHACTAYLLLHHKRRRLVEKLIESAKPKTSNHSIKPHDIAIAHEVFSEFKNIGLRVPFSKIQSRLTDNQIQCYNNFYKRAEVQNTIKQKSPVKINLTGQREIGSPCVSLDERSENPEVTPSTTFSTRQLNNRDGLKLGKIKNFNKAINNLTASRNNEKHGYGDTCDEYVNGTSAATSRNYGVNEETKRMLSTCINQDLNDYNTPMTARLPAVPHYASGKPENECVDLSKAVRNINLSTIPEEPIVTKNHTFVPRLVLKDNLDSSIGSQTARLPQKSAYPTSVEELQVIDPRRIVPQNQSKRQPVVNYQPITHRPYYQQPYNLYQQAPNMFMPQQGVYCASRPFDAIPNYFYNQPTARVIPARLILLPPHY